MAPHLSQYMRMFGILEGAAVYARAKFGRQELLLNVPGLRGSLRLRSGTSDRPTFQKVFLEREYDIDIGFTPRLIIDGGQMSDMRRSTLPNAIRMPLCWPWNRCYETFGS